MSKQILNKIFTNSILLDLFGTNIIITHNTAAT
jgi:hypothetical protein